MQPANSLAIEDIDMPSIIKGEVDDLCAICLG